MKEIPNDLATVQALLIEVIGRVSELEVELASVKAENSSLKEAYELLKLENLELRNRLGMNSKNSHKPPSSEGYSRKPAIEKAQGGKVGGQVGHEGKTLLRSDSPDFVVVHQAQACSCCGRKFGLEEEGCILYSRQVFDIPVPKLEITEHQLKGIVCCNQVHVSNYPIGVTAPVQYGMRIKALTSLLSTDYRMPFGKISQLVSDLYGYRINESTLTSANELVYEALAPVEEQIKAELLTSEVVHFDETGMRVEGKLHWFHTACNALFCYLYVHTARGKEALLDDNSLIKDYKNWTIHDCWSSYFHFTDCKHGLCNAHLLRELTALIENGSIWAQQMHDLLLALYTQSSKATKVLNDKAAWIVKYEAICKIADTEEPKPVKDPKARGKPKNTKGRNLLNRLVNHQASVIAFAFEINIPFTNNQAERDIRHVKVKQKVAMSFRSFNGAKVYARIQSFVATTRKQSQNTFQQLCNILDGQKYQFLYS